MKLFFKKQYGFSLVEVVLALGVIAFAIVGIIGLLPVAMQAALEAQRETRATFIAQKIFSDLDQLKADAGFLVTTSESKDATNGQNQITILIEKYSPLSVFYDDEGMAVADDGGAVFEAQLVLRDVPDNAALVQVDVRISTPAAAPVAKRSKYIFSKIFIEK